MGKKGDAPKPPDPAETAAAQTGTNVATAIANSQMGMVNQVTPDGSITYDQTDTYTMRDPATGATYQVPRYTATTTLSDEAAAIRDQNNEAQLNLATLAANQSGRADNLLSTPMDINAISPAADRSGAAPVAYGAGPEAPTYSIGEGGALPELGERAGSAGLRLGYEDDFAAQKDEIADLLLGQIDERRTRDMDALKTDLVSRGINVGTEQWSRAMDDFQRSSDNARTQAILASGQEQSRLVNLARDEATFENAARQTEFGNAAGAVDANNARALTLFGLGEDQRRYDDTLKAQAFGDERAVTARADANADKNFNQQQSIWDATDAARGRELTETLALRNQPINEITALLSGSQVATPNFNVARPSTIPTTDYAGLVQNDYQNQLANYQQEQQQWQAMMGGLFGLGSSYLIGR